MGKGIRVVIEVLIMAQVAAVVLAVLVPQLQVDKPPQSAAMAVML
jgi:hypothetical protein